MLVPFQDLRQHICCIEGSVTKLPRHRLFLGRNSFQGFETRNLSEMDLLQKLGVQNNLGLVVDAIRECAPWFNLNHLKYAAAGNSFHTIHSVAIPTLALIFLKESDE